MKKLISLALCACMLVCGSALAFAEEDEVPAETPVRDNAGQTGGNDESTSIAPHIPGAPTYGPPDDGGDGDEDGGDDGDGDETPDEPQDGGDTSDEPQDSNETPDEPQGGDTSDETQDGADTPDEAQEGGETPDEPQEEEDEEDLLEQYLKYLSGAQIEYNEAVSANTTFVQTLMDYDLALKRLAAAKEKYDVQKLKIIALENDFRFGGVEMKDIDDAKKELDTLYYEIKTLLIGISVMKKDIEAVLGTGFSNSFDFNSVYLITDATKISGLTDLTKLASVCVPPKKEDDQQDGQPDGQTPAASPAKTTGYASGINAAIKLYYELGEAILGYDAASKRYNEALIDLRLGRISNDELTRLKLAKTAAYTAVYELKVGYSKSLLLLDASSGYALTGGCANDSVSVKSLCASLGGGGSGLWKISEYGGELHLKIMAFPPIENLEKYTKITLTYNGAVLGSAALGSVCAFTAPAYIDGADTAVLTFSGEDRSAVSRRYSIPVFSAFGALNEVR